MHRYHILSPEKHIADLLESGNSAERSFFNIKIHYKSSEIDKIHGADIVVASRDFWMQNQEWLNHSGCKVCICDNETCSFYKEKGLYRIKSKEKNSGRLLNHLTALYRTYLVELSHSKEWKMYYKALISEPHPIIVTDKNGIINFMNAKAELELNVRLKEFRGVLFESVFRNSTPIDDETLSRLIDFYNENEHEISSSIEEMNMILPKGGQHPYSVTLNRLDLDNLAESPVKINLIDASDLVHLEEELQLKNTAVEQTHNGVLITNSDLEGDGPHIEYVNQKMLDITGYERDELLGKNPRMLQGPKTNRNALKDLKNTLKKGGNYKAKAVNYRKDGSEYYVEWNISPIRNKHGNISYYVSIQEDKTKEVIQSAEVQRLATIVDYSRSAVITFTENGQILSINKSASELIGLNETEVTGNQVFSYLNNEYFSLEKLRKELAPQETLKFENLIIYTHSGQRIIANVKLYYLNNDHQNTHLSNYLALAIDDVTEQQRANVVLEDASEKGKIGGWEMDIKDQLIHLSKWVAKEFNLDNTTVQLNDFLNQIPTATKRAIKKIVKSNDSKDSKQINETFQLTVQKQFYQITGQREESGGKPIWRGLIQDVTEKLTGEVKREWRKQITEKIAKGYLNEKIYEDINAFIENEIGGARSIITFFKNNYVYEAHTNSLDDYKHAILNYKVIPNAGPCSEAFCTQKPIIAPNIYKVERWTLFHKIAEPMGVQACWSYPVEIRGKVIATVALFLEDERKPNDREAMIIETVQQIIQLLVEREEQRKDLIITTQKLENAQNIAGIGDWMLTIEERIFSVISNNIVTMYELDEEGTDKSEITLDRIFERVYEDDLGYVKDVVRDAISRKTSFNMVYRVGPFSNGKLKYLNTIGEYSESEYGPILSGITQDVTESKLAEEKLIESLNMWSSLVNTQPNPLIIIDRTRIEFLNPSAQQLLGVEDDVLDSSMSLYDYVIAEDHKQLKRFIDSPNNDVENTLHISFLSKNRNVKHVIVRSAEIVYEGKKHKQLVLSDITTIVNTQAELQKVRDSLEVRVKKRTEELSAKNDELLLEIEKRRKAEKELLDTSLQLSTIFNHSKQIFILLDDQFRIISYNEVASQWADEVIGKPMIKFSRFDEYDILGIADDMRKRFSEALSGVTSHKERMLESEDGKTRWVQVEYIPVREDEGELPDKVLFVATDISNRKQTENELRDNKKLLESINEHVSQGIFRLTEEKWLYANDALLDLIEVSQVEDLNKFELNSFFKSPDECAMIAQQLSLNEGIENLEIQIQSALGKVYDVLVSAFVHKDNQGGIAYVDGTVTDITERKESEVKLRESEKLYRDLYENMSQGVLYHIPDGSIVNINDAACRILGQSRDQLLGVSSLDPEWKVVDINGELLPGEMHPVMKAFKHSKPVTNEMIGVYRPHHKDFRWLNVHAQPQLDEQTGEPVSAVVTFEDITPLKVANEKIEEARQQTEQMARAKEQFLANMSHEIRTPMSGIKGMAYLLNRTDLDEDQNLYVKNIIESSQNLLVIINDILDISKIESGKITFEHSTFSIQKVIESVMDMMRVQVGEHLKIVSDIDKNLPEYVIGDSSRLNQILFNLVGNAVKFTDQGYVTVKAEPEKMGEEECVIKISVEDTGIGIAEDKLDTIFDIFTQVDGSSTKKYRGTGLGLHITKRLIEMQGGGVEAISKPGVGSLFTVWLPFEIERENEIAESKETQKVDLKNIDVLVVDDNAVNALWAEKLLEKWNVKVETVTSGLDAIEFLKTRHPDIILMDIQMPEMNGYETTQFIRKNLANHENSPIIGVTADVLRNQMDKCKQAGMNSYLAKPYEPEQMLKVLTNYVNLKG